MRNFSRIYNPTNNLQMSFQTNCKSKKAFFFNLGALYVLNLLNMCLIYMTCAKHTPIMLSIKLTMLFIHLTCNYMRMFT